MFSFADVMCLVSVSADVMSLVFRATPRAYGGGDSQARGPVGAVAAGLHHSHSNKGSELRLRPTLQLMAEPDP